MKLPVFWVFLLWTFLVHTQLFQIFLSYLFRAIDTLEWGVVIQAQEFSSKALGSLEGHKLDCLCPVPLFSFLIPRIKPGLACYHTFKPMCNFHLAECQV